MKKFITFVLAALVIFAMCSCQPTQEMTGGKIAFTVGTNEAASKAITATGTELDVIDHIELKFTAVTQSLVDVEGQSTAWEKDLIVWDKDNPEAATNGTWNTAKVKWLSQGQWKIEARAVNSDSSKEYYYGYVQVYVSKKVNTAKITLLPIEDEATGTLKFTALKSNAPFAASEIATSYKAVYKIFKIDGTAVGDPIEVAAASSTNDVVTFAVPANQTLAQGAYTITAEVFENVSTTATADWKSAGGCVTDFIIMAGAEATVSGTVLTSEYINMNPTTTVEIADSITVSLTYENDTFTATADIEEGSTVTIEGFRWYKWSSTTGYTIANDTSSTEDSEWEPALNPGDYEIGVVAYGTQTVNNEVVHIQSNMVKARYFWKAADGWAASVDAEQGKQ